MATKVARMKETTEDRLSQAACRVSALVGDGLNPNDAVCKVATDMGLNEGLTEQTIRAYNTGRSLYQYSQGGDAREKLAQFTIADVDVILPRLYPKEVKTAAEITHEVMVSSDYMTSPASLFAKIARLERAGDVAEAYAKVRRETKLAAEPPRYEDEIHRRNLGVVVDSRRDGKLAKQAAIGAKYKFVDALDKLGQYFRRADAQPYVSVLANASLTYGDRAKTTLEAAVEGDKLAMSKAANAHSVDWSQAPYSLILTCFDKAAEAYEAEEVAAAAEKTASQRSEAAGIRPFSEKTDDSLSEISGSVLDAQSSIKTAAGLSSAFGVGLGATITGATKSIADSLASNREGAIKSQVSKLQDPQHEQSLRRIRTQAMLSDFMQHDPVIQGYGEDNVADAFNRLSEVAPNAVQHNLIAKALLRKYLEQGNVLEQFDMDQLLNLENKLHKSPQQQQQQPR